MARGLMTRERARPRAQSRDDDAAAVHLRGARRGNSTRPSMAATTTQADRPGAVRRCRWSRSAPASSATRTSTARATRCAPRGASRASPGSCRRSAAAGSAGSTRPSRCSSCAATTSPRSRCTRSTRGTGSSAWDTVLVVEGDYAGFAHLETLILGTVARRTRVCTNLRTLVDAARPKPVYYFGARSDHALLQPGDGLSAHVGGSGVRLHRRARLADRQAGRGHHPARADRGVRRRHRGGDARGGGGDVRPRCSSSRSWTTTNDSVATSLAVARALEERLWGVRLDTSEFMVDRSVIPQMGAFRPTGVNPPLVWNVRNALDAEGFGDVKIVVSGGFDLARIRAFEEDGVPVDAYGVGASAARGPLGFHRRRRAAGRPPAGEGGARARTNVKLERVKYGVRTREAPYLTVVVILSAARGARPEPSPHGRPQARRRGHREDEDAGGGADAAAAHPRPRRDLRARAQAHQPPATYLHADQAGAADARLAAQGAVRDDLRSGRWR